MKAYCRVGFFMDQIAKKRELKLRDKILSCTENPRTSLPLYPTIKSFDVKVSNL